MQGFKHRLFLVGNQVQGESMQAGVWMCIMLPQKKSQTGEKKQDVFMPGVASGAYLTVTHKPSQNSIALSAKPASNPN